MHVLCTQYKEVVIFYVLLQYIVCDVILCCHSD